MYTSTYPSGETTSYTYTPTGQQATVTDPAITNSVTGVTHQLEDSYTYDDDDNVATVTQPAGATTGGTPQSAEEGASSANPGGATTAYDYDGFGNVTRVTDPNGNQYQYTYNEYQEPTSESLYTSSANEADSTATCTAPAVQDPDGGCDLVLKSDAYDPAGLLASETDAMGRITNYGYNSDQELDEVATSEACSASVPCASAGPCTPTDECTSGAVGVTTDYQYDGAGNMVTQTEVGTGADSNRQTITNYTYDAADQLDEEVQDATPPGDQGASGYANRTTAYTYDADGHALSKTVGSGTGTALAVTDYAYDTAGDMTSQSVADQGAGGPVAWFPLTQSSGTSVPDSVSGGQPAISDGAATWNGSSATFPGDWGDISTNGPVADTTGSFSVSAWVNLAGDTSSDQIAVSQSAGTQSGFVLKYLPATGSWEFSRPETDTTDSVSNADDSTAASTGTWTLLTGTYDVNSGSMTLYVNGTAAGSATDSTPIASKGPLLIGAGQYDGVLGSFFDGSIADVQVYPYALSSSQVSTLYGKGQGGGDVTTGQLTTSWTYDQNGKPLSETSPDGNVTTYAYDPDGNLVMQTGPQVAVSAYASQTPVATQAVTTYGYDTFGDQTQVKDPDQNVTATAYDGDGRVTSVTQPSYTPPGSSTAITATTSYAYDEDGNLASETDPQGNATSYTYDALGDVTSVTDPELPGQSSPGTWTYTYDADGEQLSAKDPLGNTTSQTYDGLGNVATSTDALGSTTQYAYDYLGDQTVVDTPDGSVTTNAYNGLGDLTSSADGAGNTTTYSYNDQGNLADELHPDGTNEEYGYDQAGHETSVTDYAAAPAGQAAPELRSESFGYDADGNQTSATDWDGNTTTSLYNPADELTSQVQPASSSSSMTTSYGYDAAGNRTSVTGGNGNTTWTAYNSWNLPESVVEPTTSSAPSASDTTWTTTYNANGAPSSVTEPGGVSLSYGYDPLGDITSESGTGASASTPDRSFTYDTDQRMTSATAAAGTDNFTYNADGDLKSTSGPSGTSSYTYNNDGLVASETDAAGTTGYTYDSADRLSTETDPLTGSTLTWGYNSDSNPTSVSYAANGTAGPVQSYGYNALQQLTSDNLTSATGSLLASETYGYDNNGNVTSQATGGGLGTSSATYAYDEANRLVSSASGGTTTDYGYDGDGNLTQDGSATSVYNAQDQLTSSASSAGTTNYSYTLNGSLASAAPGSGSATDYTWDAYGDLVSAGGTGYGYDALGRLVSSTTGSGSTSISYLGTGQTIASDGSSLYSYDPSGNETAAESVSGGPGSAAAVMSDQHGDIVAAFGTSASVSSLAGYASSGPWGNVVSSGGSMPGTGFQGDYTDPTTGLVHMGARWYDPADGSFVSSDTLNGTPIPSTADGNPYAYAGGNPLTETDRTGHCGQSLCLGEDPIPWGGEELPNGMVAEYEGAYDLPQDGVEVESDDGSSSADAPAEDSFETDENEAEEFKQESEEREQAQGDDSSSVGDYAGSKGGFRDYLGDSGGSGGNGGGGGGTETPRPEPPQDAYANGDVKVPSAPTTLLDDPYITADTTAPADAMNGEVPASDQITEHLTEPSTDDQVKGLKESASQAERNELAQASNTGQDSSLPNDPTSETGKPSTPTAAGPATGSAGGAGTGGNGGTPPNASGAGGQDDSTPAWAKAARIWEPFRPGVDNEPQDELPSSIWIKEGASLEDGHYHYVVMPDGSLRAAMSDQMYDMAEAPGHTSLAERQPVIMAGTFEVEGGRITMFDNMSGHYMPTESGASGYTPLETVARESFSLHRLPEPAEGTWDPVPWGRLY